MLNIYYGRENLNKERFMYDRIRQEGWSPEHPVLVIVPDQYTLEAERQALRWLKTDSLMGLEVVSMSRLGHRILEELGGARGAFVDKYGRQMLLTRIIREVGDDLQVFRGRKAGNSFVEMVNNFISELKQYGIGPEDLEELGARIPETELLHRKLADMVLLYRRYQEEIAGKYTDSEDYIDLYVEKIGRSGILLGARVWVYGFDSFAPKSMEVLRGIMKAAEQVNVVLTLDRGSRDQALFSLTEAVFRNLVETAVECGCQVGEQSSIDPSYVVEHRVPGIVHLEQELYAVPCNRCDNPEGITLVESANIYNEAESAAAFVLHLLRDKGYRKRDIVMVCNDQSESGQIIARVFQEYGLSVFHDNKRGITDSPVASFLLSMLEVVQNRWRTQDIFRTLKSGFVDIPTEDIEKLEIYSGRYRIRGSMWKKEFVYGASDYGDDGLWELNCTREKVCEVFQGLEEIAKSSGTVREFAASFYAYLTEELSFSDKLKVLIDGQTAAGLGDLVEETEQIFRMVLRILDQIVELTGDDPFRLEEFLEIFRVGLEQLQIGILPVSVDDLMMGTMQRTRTGDIRALVVLGANDGLLPCQVEDKGLFAITEIDRIAEEGYEICKVDRIRRSEEQLAIYRNLSKPSEHLWISWSAASPTGESMTRSELIDDLRRVFPEIPVLPDVLNGPDDVDLVGGSVSTMRHLVDIMRRKNQSSSSLWSGVEEWYREHEPDLMEKVDNSLAFRNAPVALGERSRALFGERDGVQSLSPSRLETYSRCPFRYFLQYGLRPKDDRVFEISPLELGSIYHLCFMDVAEHLTMKALWHTVTQEEVVALVSETVDGIAAEYRDGLMAASGEEKYRTRRIKDTCAAALWMLVLQVRDGKIDHSAYEVPFGIRRELAPVEIVRGNRRIVIEGKIDRLDVLSNGRLNIIDYKSGDNKLDPAEIRAGYRLQLMLYMKAARGEEKEPAGVFYFHIHDPRIEGESVEGAAGDTLMEKLQGQLRKAFFLKGILVNKDNNVEEVAGEFEKQSEVMPVSMSKNGLKGTAASILMTEEEFQALSLEVDAKLEELADQMIGGEIPISPMRTKSSKPCDFCDFKSVCRFDTEFDGCQYRQV